MERFPVNGELGRVDRHPAHQIRNAPLSGADCPPEAAAGTRAVNPAGTDSR